MIGIRYPDDIPYKPHSMSWKQYYEELLWSETSIGVLNSNGAREWIGPHKSSAEGLHHRLGDRPAVIYENGSREWWQFGQHHRDGDRPAIIRASGVQEWMKYGKRHRDGDQPAAIYAVGIHVWWQNGVKHRDGD
jgi:hypothetical protein